mmetsp:Transcript_29124/g.89030  ORF Transcript_29124/g.89030 Transcript_29124/m.89030 type:complete len:212 (-) Transcript_29124:326-961(-)
MASRSVSVLPDLIAFARRVDSARSGGEGASLISRSFPWTNVSVRMASRSSRNRARRNEGSSVARLAALKMKVSDRSSVDVAPCWSWALVNGGKLWRFRHIDTILLVAWKSSWRCFCACSSSVDSSALSPVSRAAISSFTAWVRRAASTSARSNAHRALADSDPYGCPLSSCSMPVFSADLQCSAFIGGVTGCSPAAVASSFSRWEALFFFF